MINYQGRLTDPSGVAVNGSYTFTFRLYDAATGGTKLWEEQQTVSLAEIDNGIFSVVLGASTVLDAVNFNNSLWLSVQVADDTEMSPRQRLTAVGYAMNADQVDGLDSTKFVRTDADSSSSGKLTLTKSGAALLIKPSTDPAASTALLDIQNAAGTSKFSVDLEGDTVVAGNLAVSGTISGSTSTTGTTNASWNVGSGTNATTTDVSLLYGQSSGQESLIFDGDNTDDFVLSDDLRLSTQATLRLEDDSGGDYVALKAPTGVTTYTVTLPAAVATAANQVLTSDTSGTLSWTTAGGISGVGDVTDVGNCTGSACFTGTTGTTLTSTTSDAINLATDATFIFARNDAGDVTFQGKDDDTTANTIYDTTGAGTITVGSADVTSITLTTDGTGTGEVVLPNDSVGVAEIAQGTAGQLLMSNTTPDTAWVTMSGDASIDGTGTVAVSNDSHTHGGSTLTHGLDDAYDDSGASPLVTVDTGSGAAGLEFQLTGKDFLIDGLDSTDVITLESETNNDTVNIYVQDDADANEAELVIVPSDGGVIIDTTGAADFDETGASPALTNVSDAREALAIASLPTATISDGAIKLGRKNGKWEYIWYNSDEDKFVFSASTRVESSSPAYLLFSPPRYKSDGITLNTDTNRYGIKFDPEVTPKTVSFVEITNPGASQIENTLFEMKAGGRMALEFANLVRNGSFEAFSAIETFMDGAVSGGTGGSGSNFQGGWSNFSPDEWVWVAGKVFQHAPGLFTPGTTVTATNLQQDYFHGKSAVSIQDGNTSATYGATSDATILSSITNDGAIKQTLKGLKPSTTYAIGVKARVTAANTAAKVNITGEDSAGQLTPINTSAAGELSTNSTEAFQDLIGTFKTSDTAGEITVYLICQQTGSPSALDMCRFDAVQVVASKSVPEFAPNTIVDTGDQTLYGSLRMGRTSDDRGGILSVDKSVRTRAIEFFEKDPGMSGTSGGFGGVGSATKLGSGSGSTITMTTSGTYFGANPRDMLVTITQVSPAQFKWEYRECAPTTGCTGSYSSGGTGLAVSSYTSATELSGSMGVKIAFANTGTVTTSDQWSFFASGMNMAAQYSSYSGTSTYTPGQTRIYKDPYSQKLTFQDGTTVVTLDQIATSGIGQPARVDPPMFFPASAGGGTMYLNTNQGYTGTSQVTFDFEIQGNDAGTGRDTFRWRDNVDNDGAGAGTAADWDTSTVVISAGGGPYTVTSAGTGSYGFTITFGSPAGTYADGNVGDRWQVAAYPATSSSAIKTLTGNQGVSVTGTGDSRTVAVKDCAANEILKRDVGDTDWVCAADASGGSGTVTSVSAGTGLSVSPNPITTSGAVSLDYGATLAGNPTLAADRATFASTGIIFEGATADLIEGLLTVADPATTDKTWTLPDLTGTLPVLQASTPGTQQTGHLNISGVGLFNQVKPTIADNDAVIALSGNAGNWVAMSIGRTAAESKWGVAQGAGAFASDAQAGDIILRAENTANKLLLLSGAGASALSIAAASPHVSVGGDLDVSAHAAVGGAASVSTTSPVVVNEVKTDPSGTIPIVDVDTSITLTGNSTATVEGMGAHVLIPASTANTMGTVKAGQFAAQNRGDSSATTVQGIYAQGILGAAVGAPAGNATATTNVAAITQAYNNSANTGTAATNLYGLRAIASNSGPGTVSNAQGVRVELGQSNGGAGAGTITDLRGVNIDTTSLTAGTVTTSTGLYVNNMGLSGGTNAYGIYLANQSGSATNVGLALNANKMTVSDGAFIDLSPINASSTTEGLKLPQATACTSATAEGQVCWDTDNENLYVGTASGAQLVGGGGSTSGTVTSVDSGAGLTGGPITGSGTLAIGDGTGIAVAADAISVATTELGTATWGAGDATWTFDATTGTNPTLAWTDSLVTLGGSLKATGNAAIGSGAIGGVSALLDARGNVNSCGLGCYGILLNPTTTTTEGTATAVYARSDVNAAATFSNVYGLYVANPTKSGGAAITNNYGLVLADLTAGGTKNAEINFEGTTPVVQMANGGTLTVNDGTNTLMTLADSGTSGTLTVATLAATTLGTFNGGIAQTPTTAPTIKGSVTDATRLNATLGVAVQGRYAYVIYDAASAGGITVVDVSNPASPAMVGGSSFSHASLDSPTAIQVAGRYAYVTSNVNDRLNIVDISNPSSLSLTGSLQDATNLDGASDVFVAGPYAYVAAFGSGRLTVVDVSNPASPTVKGSLLLSTFTGKVYAVWVQGRYAYLVTGGATLAANGEGVYVVDVSNPASPSLTGSLGQTGTDFEFLSGRDIKVSGRYAYVPGGNINLAVVDMSNPAAPARATAGATLQGYDSVWIDGAYAYLPYGAGANTSFGVVNLATPTSPTEYAILTDASFADPMAISVAGKYAYVTSSPNDKLIIVDLNGADLPALTVGSVGAGTLNAQGDLAVGNSASIGHGLQVGPGGLLSQGNVSVMDGAMLDLSGINTSATTEGLRLPQATSCASGTAEGQICWDTDNDLLYIGNASTAVAIDGSTTNELNTFTADAGGATTGTAITLAGGTNGIDTSRASDTVTFNFDPTEVGSITWGSAGAASYTHTYNVSTGTDPALTFGNNSISTSNAVTISNNLSVSNAATTTGTGASFVFTGLTTGTGINMAGAVQNSGGHGMRLGSPASAAAGFNVDTILDLYNGTVGLGIYPVDETLGSNSYTGLRIGDYKLLSGTDILVDVGLMDTTTDAYTSLWKIDDTGKISYNNTGRPLRTIVLTASGAITASGNATQTLSGTNFKYWTVDFADGATQTAAWQFVVPDSFDAVSPTVNVTLYWMSSATTGNCRWSVAMDGKPLDSTTVFDGALQTASASADATLSTANALGTISFSGVTSGWADSELAVVQVQRIGADGTDTLAATAKLVAVKIEYLASDESD